MQGELSFTVATDHPAFPGHFPGRPIVPGVVLLDAALHAVQQACLAADENPVAGPAMHCQIATAKFLSPVQPGETLTISYTRTDKGLTRFEIACGARPVASGAFAFGSAA
ncbi:3-hydroxyacyl-ACP dehydratase FabZ family protein [Polaromonas sp.]|uniref:3-hydroxyacyl-ACP dehydratase FabZ family protein n=1 Tax=Polaromonas sp. TaxID=1869339 RepID=UPI003524015D